jgi:hypothetical protein
VAFEGEKRPLPERRERREKIHHAGRRGRRVEEDPVEQWRGVGA